MIKQDEFISLLTATFNRSGLGKLLSHERALAFYKLTELMLEENEKYNLTAIVEPEKIILSHYADSAVLALKLPRGGSVIDVGCGAGFPTLPLAILRDDLTITAMDSTAKRVDYVRMAADALGLRNVRTVTMRAEDGGRDPSMREKFDTATARAVAELRILAELCLPFVKRGGSFIAMKGKNAEFELSGAKRAIAMLGGREPTVEEVKLTSQSETLTHPLIMVKKGERTPDKYPRPYAQISKKPL